MKTKSSFLKIFTTIFMVSLIFLGVNIIKINKNQEIVRKSFNYKSSSTIEENSKVKIVDFLKQIMSANLLKEYRLASGLDIKDKVFVPSGDFEEIINISGDKEAENIIVEEQKEEKVDQEGVPTNYVNYIECEATAYCLCKKCTGKTPGHPDYGKTASGLVITPGINMKVCAVSKKQIPLLKHTNSIFSTLKNIPSFSLIFPCIILSICLDAVK